MKKILLGLTAACYTTLTVATPQIYTCSWDTLTIPTVQVTMPDELKEDGETEGLLQGTGSVAYSFISTKNSLNSIDATFTTYANQDAKAKLIAGLQDIEASIIEAKLSELTVAADFGQQVLAMFSSSDKIYIVEVDTGPLPAFFNVDTLSVLALSTNIIKASCQIVHTEL